VRPKNHQESGGKDSLRRREEPTSFSGIQKGLRKKKSMGRGQGVSRRRGYQDVVSGKGKLSHATKEEETTALVRGKKRQRQYEHYIMERAAHWERNLELGFT